jgi:Putative beta-barrel porin-2, OmpL-like. bbp2
MFCLSAFALLVCFVIQKPEWHGNCSMCGVDRFYIPFLNHMERYNMKKVTKSLLCAGLVSMSAASYADTPTVPTLSSVLDASGISLSGDIDVAYSHLSGTGVFTSTANDRVFDYAPNSFTVQALDLMVTKTPTEGFGGVVEATVGKDASTIASSGMPNATYDLTQAYVQYATGNLTVIGGKFLTLAGAEVIKASGNTNYSRSILFGYAIPFAHTGARASYKISDAASVTVGVNNGWDNAADTNAQKTVELGVALNPVKSFALTAQVYSGAEAGAATGTRNLLDLVGTITLTDSLNVVFNYDNGSQDNAVTVGSKAKWSGLAGYVNYQISDPWRVSVRGEYFNDKDGYRTGVIQKWKEATITLGYAASKSTELRGEVRSDKSDVASFMYSDGVARKSQTSVALEAVYKF